MTSYIFDNAVEAETADRFISLDALYNPRSFQFLEATGIRSGWRCLEIGGGSGSVATWMAERVGPSGYVLVTDIDPRFIETAACQKRNHVEVRRHDIGTDPLPEAAFDLIHARLVLLHVPQRHEALERLARALKPGGWLVIEEFDGRLFDRAIPTADATEAASFAKMMRVLAQLMDDRGFEAEWARGLYGRLKLAGLIEVGMAIWPTTGEPNGAPPRKAATRSAVTRPRTAASVEVCMKVLLALSTVIAEAPIGTSATANSQ
jgi:ubiquinone/menaquinone biosynthesis C-methylase UbiE